MKTPSWKTIETIEHISYLLLAVTAMILIIGFML